MADNEETVERVARAICVAAGFDPDEECYGGKLGWQLWEPETRAAIAAMREPTDAMLVSGFLAAGVSYEALTNDELKQAWQAMIDAALPSPPEGTET